MSHFLNNTFEAAFAVHGFLERNARGSDHFRHKLGKYRRCRFFDALHSGIPSALILKALRLPGLSVVDAECNLTGRGPETYVHRFKFRKAIEKLSEFRNLSILVLGGLTKLQSGSLRSRELQFNLASFSKWAVNRMGSPRRRPRTEAPLLPPRLSCAQTFFDSQSFGRSDFKSDSRSAPARLEDSQNPFGWPRNLAQFVSRIACQQSQKKFRNPDVQEKRVRHEGQGGGARVDTDFRLKRVHLHSPPSHHFFGIISGFPKLQGFERETSFSDGILTQLERGARHLGSS
jgi:hypothetical protein